MTKMKQLQLLMGAVIILLASCSSSKNAIAPRKDFKGNWEIVSATVEGAGDAKLNVTAFDDVALKCFEGSQWTLPNNGYGTYNIAAADCAGGERQILWSQRVRDGKTLFNFKRMDGVRKKDSKDVEEGYSMEVTGFDENGFTAMSPVEFEGKTIYIVYDFQKR
ncbi:lipocalin family protein [Niabella terrae]